MDNEENVQQTQKPSSVLARTIHRTEYCMYLHGVISDPTQFYEHYAVMKSAQPDDLIKLYINSPGGDLATTMEYVEHMRDCQAPILAMIGMNCASGASVIALNADGWDITPFSTFLVHGFSYGIGGSAPHVMNHASFNSKLNERFVREIYKGFLTEEEFSDVFKGIDILIDSDDLGRRLSEIAKMREEEENESVTEKE